jgi:hypothetical protein
MKIFSFLSLQKYFYKDGSVSYANRGYSSCTPGSDGTGGATYCCSTDYCNGGVSLSSTFSLAFSLVAAVIMLKTVIINWKEYINQQKLNRKLLPTTFKHTHSCFNFISLSLQSFLYFFLKLTSLIFIRSIM